MNLSKSCSCPAVRGWPLLVLCLWFALGCRKQEEIPTLPPVDKVSQQILGKTKDQLVETFGKPDKTQKSEGEEDEEYWYYDNKAFDPKAKEAAFIQVIIQKGKAVRVNY